MVQAVRGRGDRVEQGTWVHLKVLIPDDLASLSDDAIIEHMASIDRDSAEWQQFTRDGQWTIVGDSTDEQIHPRP